MPKGDPTDPSDRPGIGDAHGVVALVGGLVVLVSSCVCCYHRIDDDAYFFLVAWCGAAALWSGLFGLVTPGSSAGKVLAWVGLAFLAVSLFAACVGAL